MNVKEFYDPATFTLSYVLWEPDSKDAVVIDPVLDFDPLLWRTSTTQAEAISAFVAEAALQVRWVLDTHAHADHLTGMQELKQRLGARSAIGAPITQVQALFAGAFGLSDDEVPRDGSQFDRLLSDGDLLDAGAFQIEAIHTPGHTPACMSYRVGDMVFTGDALFMPDYGVGRCDFPRGSAGDLYDSVTKKLYRLPPATRVLVGHDYQPGGRELAFETTIGESMQHNIQLRAETSREDFVRFRTQRDATLAPPRLILQSLQVNVRGGSLPAPEDNGRIYLKMPVNFLGA